MSVEVLSIEFAFSVNQLRGLELAMSILDRGIEDVSLFRLIVSKCEATISYLETFAGERSSMWNDEPLTAEAVAGYRARLLMYLARYLSSPSLPVVEEVLGTLDLLVQQCADGYGAIFLGRLEELTSRSESQKNWRFASRLGSLIARLSPEEESYFGELPESWGWWCIPLWRAATLQSTSPWKSLDCLAGICERSSELSPSEQRKVRCAINGTLRSIEILAILPDRVWYNFTSEFESSLLRIYSYLEDKQREPFYRAVWSLQERGLLIPGRVLAGARLDLNEEVVRRLLDDIDENEFWALLYGHFSISLGDNL